MDCKKLFLLSFLAIITSCAKEDTELVEVSFRIPAGQNSQEAFKERWLPIEQLSKGFRDLPASGLGFTCLALNIIGPGIPSTHSKVVANETIKLIDSGETCTYPGITTPTIGPGASSATLTAFVPPGTPRLIQVIGLQDTSGSTNCTKTLDLGRIWQGKYDNGTAADIAYYQNAYEVGRKVVSLPRNNRFFEATISDSFNSLVPKPIFGHTVASKNCPYTDGSGTLALKCSLDTNTAPSGVALSRNLNQYSTGGVAPYTFSGTPSQGTLTAPTFSYGSAIPAGSITGVTITDSSTPPNTASCTIELKDLNSTTMLPSSSRVYWAGADQLTATSTNWANQFTGVSPTEGPSSVSGSPTPVYTTSISTPISPYLKFNASEWYSSSTAFNLGELSSLSIFIVGKLDDANSRPLLAITSTGGGTLKIGGLNSDRFAAELGGTTLNIQPFDTNYHLHVLRLDKGTFNYTVSSVGSVDTKLTGTLDFSGSTLIIGNDSTSAPARGTLLKGEIAEVIVAKSLPIADDLKLRSYLKSKYRL